MYLGNSREKTFFPHHTLGFGFYAIRRVFGYITLFFKNIINLSETHPMEGLVTKFKIELGLLNA